MSCRNRMYPGVMVLMVGLMPFAASQAQAQSASQASLLSVGVITLPSDTMQSDTDTSAGLLSDLALPDADLLGAQETTSLSHASSGNSSGWLLGGVLSAAAGVAGLASGGGSGAAGLLRAPSSTPGPVFTVAPNTSVSSSGTTISTVSGNTISAINSGSANVVSSGSSGVVSGGESPLAFSGGGTLSGGGIGAQAVTPEPGSLAMFGGMGLMFTAFKLRRRKR